MKLTLSKKSQQLIENIDHDHKKLHPDLKKRDLKLEN